MSKEKPDSDSTSKYRSPRIRSEGLRVTRGNVINCLNVRFKT